MRTTSITVKSYVLNYIMREAVFLALLLSAFLLSSAHAATDHSSLITSYEGSKTCRTCHEDVMDGIVDSIHYKLMGQVQDVYNMFTNKPVEGLHGKGNRY